MALPVIFKWEKGEHPQVCAFFPTLVGDMSPATMTSYAHVGQHSAACMDYVRECKPAKPHEYADLLGELKAIGYDDLVIIKRQSRAHYEERKAYLQRVGG